LGSFYVLTIWVFVAEGFGAKAALKTLVKLTPGGSTGPKYVLKLLFSEKS
jgi:hypothetical protein